LRRKHCCVAALERGNRRTTNGVLS
jgi:hypothetical protein